MENYKRRGIALLLLVVLGGCRVDASVEARVHESGGSVSVRFVLDREAVAVVGGVVAEGAQKSDLEEAGWEISPLRTTEDGGAEVELSKDFSRPGDLGAVVAELAGPAGPLREFRLERHRSFTGSTFRLTGTADVGAAGGDATGFANTPDLPERLRAAGVDPGRVEELLAGRAAEGLHVRLVVGLPGAEEQAFEVRPGSPVTVDVASEISDRRRPVLLVVAVVTGLIVLFRLRRRTSQT